MEGYDAFTGGVEPGGLRTKSEIKTLICYLARVLDAALTREQISDVLQAQGIANYFEVSDALGELISGGVLRYEAADDRACIRITPAGAAALASIENDLPRTVRERAVDESVRMLTAARNARQTETEILPRADGYAVRLAIIDGGDALMRVELYVADEAQARQARARFLEDPVAFYSNLVSKLY